MVKKGKLVKPTTKAVEKVEKATITVAAKTDKKTKQSVKSVVEEKKMPVVETKKNKKTKQIVDEESIVEEKREEKAEIKDEKGLPQTIVYRTSVEQCILDIKSQAVTAVKALKTYFEAKGGKSLFPQIDYALFANVVYKKPAFITEHARAKILLPYPEKNFHDSSICLILPDLDQTKEGRTDPDVDKQARQWAEKIENDHDLKNKRVTIYTKRQLERQFHTFNERRKLATQHDLFLVDNRVAKSVCSFLGKDFHRAHKQPLWFDYYKPLSETISNGLKTVSFPLNRYMTRASVQVGHLGQETSDLSENINTVIDKIVEVCPGGLLNIRSMHLQPNAANPSLPIFHDDGPSNDVELKKENKHKRFDQKVIVDDCNTLPEGLKLEVRRNGRLRVLKEEDGKGILFPTVDDEWEKRDLPNTKATIDPDKLEQKKINKAKKRAARESQAIARASIKKARKA